METKTLFASKIVWYNLIMTTVEFLTLAKEVLPQTWLPYLLLAHGLGTIILRIWFTDKPLTI